MRSSWLVIVIAACGSPRPGGSTPPANSSGAKSVDATAWAAVIEGATFSLVDSSGEGKLAAHVDHVESTPTKRTIHLSWAGGGDNKADTIEITADKVVFVERNQSFVRNGPPIDETSRVSRSFEQKGADGTTCYVEEDPPPSGDCEDICMGEFCIDPKLGLVGGMGFGWPGLGSWQQPGAQPK